MTGHFFGRIIDGRIIRNRIHWPGGHVADKLVVVSENAMTPDARKYLNLLRGGFKLPIFFQHIDLASHSLGEVE
jgi:hypothetical protein